MLIAGMQGDLLKLRLRPTDMTHCMKLVACSQFYKASCTGIHALNQMIEYRLLG